MTQDGYAFWQLKKAATRQGGSKKHPVESLQRAWERYCERATAAAKNATDESRAEVHEAIDQHLGALNLIAVELA